MKKTIRSLISCLLAAVMLLGLTIPTLAGEYDGFETVEEISLNGWEGENYTLRTPADEPCTLYVEGCSVSQTEVFLISVLNQTDGAVIRTFVRPDENGAFSVCIHTESGNSAYPTAERGTVIADETGGQSGTPCYDTVPGYRAVPEIADGFYRVTVTRATTAAQADAVYDGGWGSEDNPLGGSLGYACKEFVVEMTDNDPQVVDFTEIRSHNAAVRSLNAELTEGSDAYAEYTDTYLKDIEWAMDTTGTTHPMTAEKVAYLKSAADEITAPAESDYEKVRLIYEYLSDHFYYDYYAYSHDNKRQYCNPYDNLRALRDGVEVPNSSNGRVATVCNGFASMVIALARAEGIPARMARGYHIDTGAAVWNDSMQFTTKISHWWSEVYVDGHWVVVDANSGCQNVWRRTDWDDDSDEAWTRGDVRSYSGFDMTEQALANNYYYSDFYSDYKDLQPPRITAVDVAPEGVTLRWESVEGADAYYVYRGTTDGDLNYLGASKSATPTQYVSTTEEEDVTYYYRVRAVKDKVEGTWSNMVTAAIPSPAAITEQPRSVCIPAGETARFTVAAEGTDLTYQWQYSKGENWANSGLTGNNTDTLSVPATVARNGQQYRCAVTRAGVTTVYSDEAVLTIETVITDQPADATASVGQTAQFTVAASGAGLTYQWQYHTGSKWLDSGQSGNRTDTLSVPATAARNGQQYRCVIVDANGNTCTTDAATLTVTPFITSHPADVYAPLRDTAVFHVEATGEGLIYRWQYYAGNNWQNATLPGHDTDTLSVPVVSNRHLYRYRCVVTDENGGKAISNAATLYITATMAVQPKNISSPIGSVAEFFVAIYGTPKTYSWQYQVPGGSWKNSGLTGHDTSTLKVPVTAARNGYRYRCVVKDIYGAQVISKPGTLTVKTAITVQPADVTAAVGEIARFTVAASGIGLTYQWQYYNSGRWINSGMSGNKTDTLSVPATAVRNGQKYRCVITDAQGEKVFSDVGRLRIRTVITAQPSDVFASAGSTALFTVEASGAGLTYQWQYYSGSRWVSSGMNGNKTATLSVPATAARNGQRYRCVITDWSGEKTVSDAGTLLVT